jgi:hypothetical protein
MSEPPVGFFYCGLQYKLLIKAIECVNLIHLLRRLAESPPLFRQVLLRLIYFAASEHRPYATKLIGHQAWEVPLPINDP